MRVVLEDVEVDLDSLAGIQWPGEQAEPGLPLVIVGDLEGAGAGRRASGHRSRPPGIPGCPRSLPLRRGQARPALAARVLGDPVAGLRVGSGEVLLV